MASSSSSASSSEPPHIKRRIITHMNEDHTDSLRLYLQHFAKVPPPTSPVPDPTLEDISLSGITIAHHVTPTSAPAITFIPFNPPMNSLSESRVRLVAMTEEAQEALSSHPTTSKPLTRVTGPTPFGWIISLLVLQTVVFFCPPIADLHTFAFTDPHHSRLGPNWNPDYPSDLPDTLYTRSMLFNYPPLIRLLWEWRRAFWVLVVGIHVVESVMLDKRLVGRYGVRRGSAVWAGWIGWCLVEGWGTFVRCEKVWREDQGRKEGGGKKRV